MRETAYKKTTGPVAKKEINRAVWNKYQINCSDLQLPFSQATQERLNVVKHWQMSWHCFDGDFISNVEIKRADFVRSAWQQKCLEIKEALHQLGGGGGGRIRVNLYLTILFLARAFLLGV